MIYQFRLQSPDPNCNNCIGSIVKVDLRSAFVLGNVTTVAGT